MAGMAAGHVGRHAVILAIEGFAARRGGGEAGLLLGGALRVALGHRRWRFGGDSEGKAGEQGGKEPAKQLAEDGGFHDDLVVVMQTVSLNHAVLNRGLKRAIT